MMQGNMNRFDVGFQYIFDDQFSFGIAAAITPLKNDINSSMLNSISAFAGVRWQGFRFGYSYDINTNELMNTGGIHEFSIAYDFSVNKRALDRYKCVSYF